MGLIETRLFGQGAVREQPGHRPVGLYWMGAGAVSLLLWALILRAAVDLIF
jgi:hypothetical protein